MEASYVIYINADIHPVDVNRCLAARAAFRRRATVLHNIVSTSLYILSSGLHGDRCATYYKVVFALLHEPVLVNVVGLAERRNSVDGLEHHIFWHREYDAEVVRIVETLQK